MESTGPFSASIDCVHLEWNNCPSGFKGECKGKDSKPTLAFEVVVTNEHRIQSVSGYSPGAQNDKTISQHDLAVKLLRTPGSFLASRQFTTLVNDGTKVEHTGAYYICDGGYCKWPCLIPPYKDQDDATNMYAWSKHVEGL